MDGGDNGGVSGVRKNKTRTRICKLGCGKGSEVDKNAGIFLCSVPPEMCERDGGNSLAYTREGNLMG